MYSQWPLFRSLFETTRHLSRNYDLLWVVFPQSAKKYSKQKANKPARIPHLKSKYLQLCLVNKLELSVTMQFPLLPPSKWKAGEKKNKTSTWRLQQGCAITTGATCRNEGIHFLTILPLIPHPPKSGVANSKRIVSYFFFNL